MKHLTEKKLVLVLIAGCLLIFLYRYFAVPAAEIVPEVETSEMAAESVNVPASSHERVIYTCRLGNEEIPAVQISEVQSDEGQATDTVARVVTQAGIDVTAVKNAPVWDYKAISAHSGEKAIVVVFDPDNGKDGDDWILTLTDANTDLTERVRDCQEVSDE